MGRLGRGWLKPKPNERWVRLGRGWLKSKPKERWVRLGRLERDLL